MTSALQNRLVGTIIVVALVVILVPEFLDGEKRSNQQEFMDIPPVSELVEVAPVEDFDSRSVESEMTRPVEVIDEKPVDDVTQVPSENTSNQPQAEGEPANEQNIAVTQTPSVTDTNTPVQNTPSLADIDLEGSGWVVQLGSFRHQKNVRELMKKLKDAGYRSYSRPVQTTMGELTKVFIGPEVEREKLERALPHLKEITQLTGKITAYEVSAD